MCSDALVPFTVSTMADGPQSVYVADMDGDGRVDVLSASREDDLIAWYRNDGGSPVVWTPFNITTSADGAVSVHAADLDGDGRLDVLSASRGDNKVAWYKNGGGTPVVWIPHNISTITVGAVAAYPADVDGDGRLDVLSAGMDGNRILWFKNGGGIPVVWTPFNITSSIVSPTFVYAADMDGDGRLDVLSASRDGASIAWHKNGAGNPMVWTSYNISTTAPYALSVNAADLDGDGRLDVLSASYTDDKIAWYKNGGGSPMVWTQYNISTTADGAHSVHAVDVDGDGRVDVLSAAYNGNTVAWYKNGGGSPMAWTPYTIATTAYGAISVVSADVDGDGRQDVVSASRNGDKIAWYRNMMCPRGSAGPGGYAPCTPCPAGRFGATSLLEACEACPSGKYSLGAATTCRDALVPSLVGTTDGRAASVFAADLNSDGLVDVLSTSMEDGKIAWYMNSGGGDPVVWTPYTITANASGAHSVHAADLDGDGRLDVLSASNFDNKIAWYKNGGSSPVVWTPYTISNDALGAWSVYAADVDGDGRLDVLSASGTDNKIAWYKNGGGSPVVWTPYVISSAAHSAGHVYVGDLDGDGRLDVLFSCPGDDKVVWCKNEGGNPVVWTPFTVTTAADSVRSVCAADVDGDGWLDVLSASVEDDKVAWYKNSGGSLIVWTPYNISTTADGAWWVYAADVDGDGRVDVLSASGNDDKIAWYRNGGGSPVAWTPFVISTVADGARAVYVVDVDGDGRLDALSASLVDRKISWYRNMMCPRGSTGPGGYAPCTPCPAGRFGATSLLEACEACPAGRFGTGGGTNASCSGPCSAGFACSAGSADSTVSTCPAGTFSLAGAGACSDCAAGRFGNTSGLGTSDCSGLCPGGRFGAMPALTVPSCSGACTAGYSCPPGSVVPTAELCPPGQFSLGGASACSNCSAGTFSDTVGRREVCSSPCPQGSFCAAGSSSPVRCPAGRYGAVALLTNASCTAPCPPGSFCASGSVGPSPCPAG
jgi:hypothetical protein